MHPRLIIIAYIIRYTKDILDLVNTGSHFLEPLYEVDLDSSGQTIFFFLIHVLNCLVMLDFWALLILFIYF